jgi:chitodextrinase
MQGITLTGGRLNAFNSQENDTFPPGPIDYDDYLAASNPTITTVDLTWTATGDDGNVGRASYYDIRYSTEPITEINWDTATQVANEPTPQAAGSLESFTVTGLDYGTPFWFAMEVFDNVGQGSGLSNVVIATTQTPIILFQDDFESGMNGWSTNGVFGLWELGAPTSGPGSAYSDPTAWGTDLDNNYGQDFADENLVSPPIDLTGQTGAILAFWSWYNTELGWDGGVIEISIDDGTTWEYVPNNDYDSFLGCYNAITEQAFSGSNGGWELEMLDLTPWVGNSVHVRFRFATDCTVNSYPGWYIDDVEVLGDTASTLQAPVANAGSNQTVSDADGSGSESVTLDGSSSYDPDGGSIMDYEWTEGTEGTEDLRTGAIIIYDFSIGQHTVTLKVTDDEDVNDTDTVLITVTANQGPTANAGPDQEAAVYEVVTFDGSDSNDPDGTIFSYDWDFGDSATASGMIVTHSYSTVGPYTVTLTVTDNGGAISTDTAQVTVNSPDKVTITKAEYNPGKRELQVEATSTASPDADLTLVGRGQMSYNARKDRYSKSVKNVPNPEWVTVSSSRGDSANGPVTVKGGGKGKNK